MTIRYYDTVTSTNLLSKLKNYTKLFYQRLNAPFDEKKTSNFINLPGSSDGQSQTLRSAMCTGLPDLATKIFS